MCGGRTWSRRPVRWTGCRCGSVRGGSIRTTSRYARQGSATVECRARSPPPLRVIDLLRQYTPAYLAAYGEQAVPQVQSVLAKLSLCRTAALGGHVYECPQCQHRCPVYNSCLDRHCPLCSGGRRADWLTKTAELLLPKIDYFQVVFTLPEQLSALMLGNRRATYRLLFHAAWAALREVLREELGCEPAALMVLHTWNQRLEHYPHLHALVPGGGPSLDGQRWVRSRHRHHHRRDKPYLVDNRLLSQRFRDKFLAGLTRLHRDGQLKLQGTWSHLQEPAAFAAWLQTFRDCDWVVYIEPPPTAQAQPEQVLKYLARYLTGRPDLRPTLDRPPGGPGHLLGSWPRQAEREPVRTLYAPRSRVHPSLGAAHSAQRLRQVTLLRRLQLPAAGGLPPPLSRAARRGAPGSPTPPDRLRRRAPSRPSPVRSAKPRWNVFPTSSVRAGNGS